jgi:gliding motility-associated-like protein
VLFRFTFDNASGAIRNDLVFADTLPEGLEFVGLMSNAVGGTVVNSGSPRHILIEGIDLPVGVFVLDLKVKVGDIPPGVYRNQAVLHNIPTELGPRRFSDDPTTPELDGTPLTVLGIETDTLYVQEIICDGSTLVLDGSPYGRVFEWFNGDTSATTGVTRPGVYRLIIWDGCEPTFIFFEVDPAAMIEATFDATVYYMHLGDSLHFAPLIINDGDSLFISWYDPRPVSLDCDSCLEVTAFPRKDAEYTFYASNEHCTDSVSIRVYVDNKRFLFVPSVFTPNEDGINDRISMFSPDPGWIESFDVIDRWGNVIFHTNSMLMNDASTGWDGTFKGDIIQTGVYLWSARVRFLDEEVEWFGGDISLVR